MRIPGSALVLPLLFLTGCALSPVVTVASLMLDGVSYVATGKSTTDHAISAVTDEDCAILRVVDGKEVCDPDGDVLFALVADDPANENWNFDTETGALDASAVTGWGAAGILEATFAPDEDQAPQVSVALVATKTLRATVSTTPALTPGLVGQGKSLILPEPVISVAAKPSPRGIFVDANPSPKPEVPQPPVEAASQIARLTLEDGHVVTYAVIASFQNIENARRMAGSRGDRALIQEIEVKGETTYRILVDQPVERARSEGFADAWPVRLCSSDLVVPPCGQLVVSQAGIGLNTFAN